MTSTRHDQRPNSRPCTRRRTRPRGTGLTAGVLLSTLLTLALLTGCDLRLESPAPPELVPDATEIARQGAAEDAAALAVLARAAAAADTALAGQLEAVAAVSAEHLEALGGLYVAHPEAIPDADGTATASPAPPPVPVAADVVAQLTTTSASARADADALADAPLARLLASIAVGRALHASVLASAIGAPVPPASFTVPAAVPAGLGSAEVTALVQAEDALGLVWEVVAARSDDPARAAAATRAAEHRSRAEAWAVAGELAGTGLDPRRAAYDLPAQILDPATDPAQVTAVLGALEASLAQDYASLASSADAGARGPLLDGFAEAATAALGQTGVVPAFPGLPERATG